MSNRIQEVTAIINDVLYDYYVEKVGDGKPVIFCLQLVFRETRDTILLSSSKMSMEHT